MSHFWKKVQDKIEDEKNINKKSINIILVPIQRYKDSGHLLQNPKVPRNIMGFLNCALTFTPLNYISVETALLIYIVCKMCVLKVSRGFFSGLCGWRDAHRQTDIVKTLVQ